nr:MFS transporter [candidate division Zixibacteria bacterium]
MEDYSKFRRKVLITSGVGTFMATLDSSIVNVSLPTISRELITSITMVGWVILSYSIALFSLLMIFGAWSEKKGFQFSYKYGFAIFGIGSFLCGVSFNIYMLILSRVLQGVGGALLISIGPALITHSFPASERGRALGVIGMVVSTGLMLGPPLGGFIIGLIGWRWIFWVNIPVSIFGVYYAIKCLSDFPVTDPDKKISIPGAVFLSVGLLTLMITLLLFSRDIISIAYIIVLIFVSSLFLMVFFYFESRPETRLIGVEIFKNRVFSFSGAAMLLIFISLSSITVLMPFYLEEVKKLSPEQVGLFLSIIPICGFFLATPAGYLADRIQARVISSLGATLLLIGILFTRSLTGASTTMQIIIPLLLAGIGMALFSTPNTSTLMGSVKKYQLGSASGILATIRTLGITVGVGLSVSIFSYYRQIGLNKSGEEQASFIFGFHSVYNIILFFITLAIIFSLIRGRNMNSEGRP